MPNFMSLNWGNATPQCWNYVLWTWYACLLSVGFNIFFLLLLWGIQSICIFSYEFRVWQMYRWNSWKKKSILFRHLLPKSGLWKNIRLIRVSRIIKYSIQFSQLFTITRFKKYAFWEMGINFNIFNNALTKCICLFIIISVDFFRVIWFDSGFNILYSILITCFC